MMHPLVLVWGGPGPFEVKMQAFSGERINTLVMYGSAVANEENREFRGVFLREGNQLYRIDLEGPVCRIGEE